MAKKKASLFECQHCGEQASKWLGKCPSCGSWESFIELNSDQQEVLKQISKVSTTTSKAQAITEIEKDLERRVQVSIVDSDNDAVYYVAKFVTWPETKLKDNEKSSVKDVSMGELIDKGYQINSGLKFGTHYRVYNYESKHAPWLIQKIDDSLTWLDVTRMVRVGHGVNKTIILAYKGHWISFDWIKP